MSTTRTPEVVDGVEIPRRPAAYHPSIHFGQQAKDAGSDRRRHLDGDIIDGCIERGEIRRADTSTWFFRETFDGVTYRLVVDVLEREVITGYPISVNTDVAHSSPRWTHQQIEDVQHFIVTDPRPQKYP